MKPRLPSRRSNAGKGGRGLQRRSRLKTANAAALLVVEADRAGKSLVVAGLLLGSSAADRGGAAPPGIPHCVCRARSERPGKTMGCLVQVSHRTTRTLSQAGLHRRRQGRCKRIQLGSHEPRQNCHCIYADNPAIYPDDLAKIGELARRDVPLLSIVRDAGFSVPFRKHTQAIESRYHGTAAGSPS